MGLLPGKPFSLDNFRSLSIDCVCREDGFAPLGIRPQDMLAVLPAYLGDDDPQAQLEALRRNEELERSTGA